MKFSTLSKRQKITSSLVFVLSARRTERTKTLTSHARFQYLLFQSGLILCWLVFNSTLLSTHLTAQNWGQVQKIVAADREADDRFGFSVSISGDYAIVGASREDEDASGMDSLRFAGSAYIFKKENNGEWTQVQKIVAADREAGDEFGFSVSISGDYAIVGARSEDEDASGGNELGSAGSAYIFKKDEGGIDNWGQVQKIVAADREAGDNFGISVSISGDYAIVGASREDEDASGMDSLRFAGSAYIFKKENNGEWTQVQKIVAADREAGDQFGFSVSISGDYAIVGASTEDEDASGLNSLSQAGSAYVFKKDKGGPDNWGQVQKIVAADREAGDFFGLSVSISSNYTIVGAVYEKEDSSGLNSLSQAGSAYIFKKDKGGPDNWGQVQKIVAADRETGDNFGRSVSISGDYVIVGAHWEDEDTSGVDSLEDAGSAYIFKKDEGGTDNWGQIQKIVAADREASDEFGVSVSISGDYAIVGARAEDEDASGQNSLSSAGSAYIFLTDEDGDGIGDLKDNCPTTPNAALDFDGVDDRVVLSNESNFDFTDSLTVEAWIRVDTFDDAYQAIVTKGDDSWRLQRHNNNNVLQFGINTGSMGFGLYGSINVNDGKWHHVAGVYDGANLYIYVDGVLDKMTAATGNVNNSSYEVGIGVNMQYGISRHFDGQIDDVRIWNVARSQSQIQENINRELTGNEPGLVAYFKLNEGAPYGDNTALSTSALDLAGNNNGTLNNFARTDSSSNWVIGAPITESDTDEDGSGDNCDLCPTRVTASLDFDGVDDLVVLPNESAFDFTDSLTVEAWIRVDTFDDAFQAIVTKGDNSWRLQRYSTNNGLQFATNGVNAGSLGLAGSININDDKWHHVAAVYDGANRYIYVDGVLDAMDAATGSISNSSLSVGIGVNMDYGIVRHFDGQIDEVRIWNSARSQSEIQANLSKELNGNEPGLVAYYNFNEGIPLQDNTGLSASVSDISGNGHTGTLQNFAQSGDSSNWHNTAPVAESDLDADGVGNNCDACPDFNDKMDADFDGIPDSCDICPGFNDNVDTDMDGTPDSCDICPGFDDHMDADNDGIPDGCDATNNYECSQDTLPLEEISLESGTYSAIETLTSQNTIEPGRNVEFTAGEVITLLPDFHADSGSVFFAHIFACLPPPLPAEVDEEIIKPVLRKTEVGMRVFPNPANYEVIVEFNMPVAGNASLEIYNGTGILVKRVLNKESLYPGEYAHRLRTGAWESGLYFVVLRTENGTLTRKLVVLE